MALDIDDVPGWRQLRALRARLGTRRGRVVASLLATVSVMAGALWAPWPGLSEGGRWTLALFGMAAVLWMTELVPLYVTSLIILAFELVIVVPVLNAEGIPVRDDFFLNPFFSNVTLLFLGGLLLAQAASRHRLDTWLAARLLRVAGDRPARVLLALMGASAFLSMWMSNTATTAMMLILVVALARQLPSEAADFRKALFLGVPFSCNLGGLGTPIGTPPNAIAVSLLEARGETIGFVAWMSASIPVLVVLLFITWRLLLKAYPPPPIRFRLPGQARDTGTNDSQDSFPLTFPTGWKPRATLAIFGAAVIAWLTGGLSGLSSGEVALVAAVLLLASGLLDSRDFRGISWDVLFLVGGGLALGALVQVSGLADWLATHLNLQGLPEALLLAVFVVATALLTTFMSNTATANMLIPLALAIPAEASPNIAPLIIAIAVATSTSMSLPVSTPPNAIAYYSGEVELREMVKHGAAISVIAVVIVWLASMSLWQWLALG